MPKVVVTKRGITTRGKNGHLVVHDVGDELVLTDRQLAKLGAKVESLEPKKRPSKAELAVVKFDVKTADVDALLNKAEELDLDTEKFKDEAELRNAVAEALKKLGKK